MHAQCPVGGMLPSLENTLAQSTSTVSRRRLSPRKTENRGLCFPDWIEETCRAMTSVHSQHAPLFRGVFSDDSH